MKIYDDYNNYTYANGNTEKELIKNWIMNADNKKD